MKMVLKLCFPEFDLWPFHPSPDVDNNGFISKDELNQLFKAANLPMPGYKVREIVQELTKSSSQLTFDEFTEVSPGVKGHTD